MQAVSNNSVDCVIVGGGLLGMLSARALQQAGLSVTVLERGALCQESSWAGGGILSPLVPWEYPAAVSVLARWSQRAYPVIAAELQEQTGIDVQWTQSGLLLLDRVADAAVTQWAQDHDGNVQVLQAAAVHALAPQLAADTGQALWLPEVAQVRNPRLGKALAAALRQAGVQLQEQQAAERLLLDGNKVRGVVTATGTVHCACVVVASGAWSPQLLPAAGPALAVEPVRGQMLQFQVPPGLLRQIVLRDGHYLIPRRDGLVLVGSTLERVGFDKSLTAAAEAELRAAAFRILPALADYPLVRQWAGLRPGSPQGVPTICEHSEIRGLYLNTGHYRNGVVLGPASAQLLADCILQRPGIVDMTPYRL